MSSQHSALSETERTAGEAASPVEWLAAKAAYEAFLQEMSAWVPASTPLWDKDPNDPDKPLLSPRLRLGWLAAAKAARRTSPVEWLGARAAYEGFLQAIKPWIPPSTPSWDKLSPRLRLGWLAAAKAARSH